MNSTTCDKKALYIACLTGNYNKVKHALRIPDDDINYFKLALFGKRFEIAKWLYYHRAAIEDSDYYARILNYYGNMKEVTWLHKHVFDDPRNDEVGIKIAKQTTYHFVYAGFVRWMKRRNKNRKYRNNHQLVSRQENELIEILYSLREHLPENWEVFFMREACRNNDLNTMKQLYGYGAILRDNYFIRSCKYGHHEMAIWLHEQGVDIRADMDEALEQACNGGHLAIVKWLVEHGCDAYRGRYHHMAVGSGNFELVKYLHELGVKVSRALMNACYNNDMRTALWIHELIKETVPVTDQIYRYAIIESCRGKNYDMLIWLHSLGVSVQQETMREDYLPDADYPDGCMVEACYNGDLKILNYLFDNGVPITPECVLSTVTEGNVDAVTWLIEKGADFSSGYAEIFNTACELGFYKIVELLISKFGVPEISPTYIPQIIKHNYYKVIKLLHTNGVNIKIDPQRYRTITRKNMAKKYYEKHNLNSF